MPGDIEADINCADDFFVALDKCSSTDGIGIDCVTKRGITVRIGDIGLMSCADLNNRHNDRRNAAHPPRHKSRVGPSGMHYIERPIA